MINEKYLNIINYFLSSLIYKHDIVAKHVDNMLQKNYGIITASPNESKYYLNLSGQLHAIDPIPTIDIDGVNVTVNRDLLNTNIELYNDFLTNGPLFKQLCATYPTLVTYFRSLVHDLTIDDVINAKDNSILYYRPLSLIEENNISLIRELNEFAELYFNTYNNINYITDELYVPGLLSVFYSFLPNKLINILIRHIKDYRISSVSRELYYNSYNQLPTDVIEENLKLRDKLNLIYDLPYIRTNIGKNEVLDIVLELFKDLTLQPERLYITNTNPTLLEENVPKANKYTTITSTVLTNGNDTISLTNMLSSTSILGYNQVRDIATLISIDEETMRTRNNNQYITKFLYINNLYYVNFNPLGILGILLNRLTELYTDNTYTYVNLPVVGISINKDKIYNSDILNMILYLLLEEKSNTYFVEKILLKSTLNISLTAESLKDKIFNYDILETFINDQIDIIKDIATTTDITSYVKKYVDFFNSIWATLTNTKNTSLQADIKTIINHIFIDNEIDVNIDINAWSNEYNFTVTDETLSPLTLINNIVHTYLGLYISDYYELLENILSKIKLFDKLTSYSVNLVYDTSSINRVGSLFTSSNLYFNNNSDVKALFKPDEYVYNNLRAAVLGELGNIDYSVSVSSYHINTKKVELFHVSYPILVNNIVDIGGKGVLDKSKADLNAITISIPNAIDVNATVEITTYTEEVDEPISSVDMTDNIVYIGNLKLPE